MEKKNFGEADMSLVVFTEDFGKIRVFAQGLRHLKSKLRYNLDLFSFSRFGLMALKDGWRLIDAEEITDNHGISSISEKLALFSRLSGFLNRMIQGEEKNTYLWSELNNIFNILRKKNLAREEIKDLEISFLLNILRNLGYIGRKEYNSKKTAIFAINKAIKESML